MKLDHLYSLRRDFTIIGLTGRTGSGCTKIADILSNSFTDLEKGLRQESDFNDKIFYRKYSICQTFLSHGDNWQEFEVIRYRDVLLLYILMKYAGEEAKVSKMFNSSFKEEISEDNSECVKRVMEDIVELDMKFIKLIGAVKRLPELPNVEGDELQKLYDIFYGPEFKNWTSGLMEILEKEGYYRTRVMLHRVSCNIRRTGDPNGDAPDNIDNIYSIAILINLLIKAKKKNNNGKQTKIVIDSLRNSLEIMFFKQRFSAFYMIATKDVVGNSKERLLERLKTKISDLNDLNDTVDKLMKMDEIEYKTNDFNKGDFSSPDVENCIQKSDYHILNLKKEDIPKVKVFEGIDGFLTREEQLMKLMALIHHPGLITPSSAERMMQIANTAKLNSGCISRKVGAAITDSQFYVKAIGWNDVAKGHTPCNLRSVNDYLTNNLDELNYSDFEKGDVDSISSFKYKGDNPGNFKDALLDYFKESLDKTGSDLNGKNCSFCFKSVHNHYEGEANQVHTRSLHAEENAMLQLTKLGGMGAVGGYLFTTASPCELCSKKAYQLGIKKIFYIDPYPGIAVGQILKGGEENYRPMLIPFSGAIGNAYDWLYESFMAYKDEVAMTLEIKPKKNLSKEFSNLLGSIDDTDVKSFRKNSTLSNDDVKALLVKAIKGYSKGK